VVLKVVCSMLVEMLQTSSYAADLSSSSSEKGDDLA
jgi:hypothetical protein